jgi:hypothetical protein
MAFQGQGTLPLGNFLQIAFSEGIRSQLSEDYRDWDMVKQVREGNPNGRQINFLFQTSFGPAAVQYRNPNFSANFPAAQQVTSAEHTAVYKELDVTVELEYNLWNLARKSPAKYAEPLANEIASKTTAAKRRLAADLYGDGTGLVGRVASVVDTAGAGGSVAVTLASSATAFQGHVGLFEFGDLLLAYEAAGTAATAPTVTGTFFAWRVKSKRRATDVVVLEAISATGAVLPLTASNLADTDYFYRVGQPTIPDRTAIADYGSATEVIPGLESLASADGRVIHGITMSGASAASEFDAGAAALDVSHIQAAMDQAKINVGQSVYAWKKMVMAPEAHAALIDSRETDRRFNTVEDNKRGIRFFAYQHGNDSLEVVTSEYVPKARIFMCPENKSSKGKVLEAHMSDFEQVKANDSSAFMLKSSSNGYERKIVTYMEAVGTLICKHPAAIARITNFTV